ncbi:glutathione S-transferase family protein [Pelomonas sp. KK5]|uniref:glutathione S-transferase family protein n=1 Tax=Pelomonas sp. KK5 TaxID=1855730 RepID=UPI00097BF783|nr:glutathione S-transferase family protein [Pelomonas sp. KK5]
MNASIQALVADTRAAIDSEGELIGASSSTRTLPRFELFSAANSVCSQKVRAVLALHGLPYRSHMMNLFSGQTYLPAHVRLRMLACEQIGAKLVDRHTGSTSVASGGGCDAAVVPTLVDWDAGTVVVDSKRICRHIDDVAVAGGARSLRPLALAPAIDAELDIIDNLPNYQMLSGKPPGEDLRPAGQRGKNGVDFAMSKVERCERYLAEFADDEVLVRGYTAKHAKELSAAQQLFTEARMREAYATAESACAMLEQQRQAATTAWLLADQVTMADLYWAIELLRMANMGADTFWRDGKRPAVAAYAARLRELPAIQQAVVHWPGALFN